jgi:ketosteroid isomerase-like protein
VDRAAASTFAPEGSNMTNETLIQTYYSGWDKREWSLVDSLLADSFTFTSANDDDHISKRAFHERCWSSQVAFIERFDLESVLASDTDAFVKYLCHTAKHTSFRNVEYFRFAGGKISAIEAYFGGRLGYPSAAVSGKP